MVTLGENVVRVLFRRVEKNMTQDFEVSRGMSSSARFSYQALEARVQEKIQRRTLKVADSHPGAAPTTPLLHREPGTS